MNTLEDVCREFLAAQSIVVCTHVSPDADAIGSSAALARALRSLGKDVYLHLSEGVPERIEFLMKNETYHEQLPAGDISLVVGVDTASKNRIACSDEALFSLSEKIVNVDHHVSNELWATVNYIDKQASASAIVVADILQELSIAIDEPIANLLLAGLMDDTGCFRFSNTDQKTFEYAAKLTHNGAKPEDVANALYFSLPERVLRLRAKALSGLRLALGGRVCVLQVTNAMLKECDALAEDTDGLVEIARSVSGTLAAIFIRELEQGWKLSLRSKTSSLDVNEVAGKFSGGGHRAAAGCRIEGSYQEVERKILEALSEQLGDGRSDSD